MNTRWMIGLLCGGALAFACGPRSHSDPVASIANAASPGLTGKRSESPKRRAGTRGKAVSRIRSNFRVDVAEREVHFALNVTNVSPKHVELSFPNGKSYDFVVVDSIGREIWHWSTGRMFTQGVRNKQLGSGDTMQVDEAWKVPMQPGHYTAIATLNSSNYPVEERADFVIP